jgi:hypothetical protein
MSVLIMQFVWKLPKLSCPAMAEQSGVMKHHNTVLQYFSVFHFQLLLSLLLDGQLFYERRSMRYRLTVFVKAEYTL